MAAMEQKEPGLGLELLLLGVLATLWGASYSFIKVGVTTIPPVTFIAARTLIAGTLLLGVLRLRGLRLPTHPAVWQRFLFQACLNSVVPFTVIAWAERTVDAGLATILNSTSPIFTFLLTAAVTRHEPATGRVAAGAAGSLGVLDGARLRDLLPARPHAWIGWYHGAGLPARPRRRRHRHPLPGRDSDPHRLDRSRLRGGGCRGHDDSKFSCLAVLAGCSRLSLSIRDLKGGAGLRHHPSGKFSANVGRWERVLADHQQLITAIPAQDPVQAATLAAEHMTTARNTRLRMYALEMTSR